MRSTIGHWRASATCRCSFAIDRMTGQAIPHELRRWCVSHSGPAAAFTPPHSPKLMIALRWVRPHCAIAAISGSRVRPSAVRQYSVFGGTTGYSLREIRPQASSSFSSLERMRSLMGGLARRSSENRSGSFRINAQTMRAFQRPPIMRVVKATGQGFANSIVRH